ncbi:hypothetical protein V6181_21095, partial [Klebsiella pneumoniae]
KRAYCLKTQPATGETYPKSDLFNKAGTQVQVSHWGFSSNSDAQILHTKSDEIITLYVHYLS